MLIIVTKKKEIIMKNTKLTLALLVGLIVSPAVFAENKKPVTHANKTHTEHKQKHEHKKEHKKEHKNKTHETRGTTVRK
jgi:mannitol-specific phosphotransferase system IIBC component